MSLTNTIFNLSMKDVNGMDVSFDKFKGKVLLVVNTASKGINKKKLKDLQKVQDKYAGRPFTVLAFPCNQLWWQEKKTNEKIKEKYITKTGCTFPVFAKSDVNGSHANEVYRWLRRKEKGIFGTYIEDNFVKFVVDSDGVNIHRFSAVTSMKDVYACIDDCLRKLEIESSAQGPQGGISPPKIIPSMIPTVEPQPVSEAAFKEEAVHEPEAMKGTSEEQKVPVNPQVAE